MIKAIRFEKTGGSDVLQYVDYDLPAPAKGQVQVRHSAIGVNFIDTYHRTGLYVLPLPSGLGSEAAGSVAAVGEGVPLSRFDGSAMQRFHRRWCRSNMCRRLVDPTHATSRRRRLLAA